MTVNELLKRAALSHSVDLQLYSQNIVNRILAMLNKADGALFAELMRLLETMPASEFQVQRLEGLLTSIRALNASVYEQIGRELTAEMRQVAGYESNYQLSLFKSTIPTAISNQIQIASVAIDQVYAAAMSRPFQGRLLSEWASSIASDRMTRIRDQIRMGYTSNETVDQIVRRIRGTWVKGYSDGVIEIDRRNAQAVVRTAVSHTAGTARDQFYQRNTSLIKAIEWASTLDLRTSKICIVRDGKQYDPVTHKPIGHKIPWLEGPGRSHFCCRSTGVPISKSWKELTGVDIPEFQASTRASMDGQVAEDLDYGSWLQKQSATRQDEILGPTRGKLMRDGKMPFDAMFTNRGQFLTLEELQVRDAKYFKAAGLS